MRTIKKDTSIGRTENNSGWSQVHLNATAVIAASAVLAHLWVSGKMNMQRQEEEEQQDRRA